MPTVFSDILNELIKQMLIRCRIREQADVFDKRQSTVKDDCKAFGYPQEHRFTHGGRRGTEAFPALPGIEGAKHLQFL